MTTVPYNMTLLANGNGWVDYMLVFNYWSSGIWFTGIVISLALIIFAAGHKRLASKYATFMYHEALSEHPYDKLSILKDDLDEGTRIMKQYDSCLISKTSLSQKQLDEVKKSRRDWYFPASEALTLGVTDEII